MTPIEKLAANRLFKGLTADTLRPIYEHGETFKASAGEILIHEGQNNSHIYFVLDGELEVRLENNPERFSHVQLGTRGAGSCVGEYSFVDKKRASATVVASRPSVMFKILHVVLEEVLGTNHALGSAVYRNLLGHLVDRLRHTNAELDLFQPL